jgi:hypothetical protein
MRALRMFLLLAVAFAGHASESVEPTRQAPAADCLDARAVVDVRYLAPDLLALSTTAGHWRVALTEACSSENSAATSLISPNGWACGGEDEYIRVGGRICGIAAVEALPPADHARLLRDSDLRSLAARPDAALATLDPIEVEGKRPRGRGFRGTTEYCFNPRHLLGWSDNRQGLLVETSPRRAGGNRWYQVELEGSCSQLGNMHSVQFHSGVGIGVICGNPGDRVTGVRGSDAPGDFARPAGSAGMPAAAGCAISAVYPLSRS